MENVMFKLWFKSSALMHYLNNKGKFICTSYQTFLTNFSYVIFCPLFSRSNNFFQLKLLTFCRSAVRVTLDFKCGIWLFSKANNLSDTRVMD